MRPVPEIAADIACRADFRYLSITTGISTSPVEPAPTNRLPCCMLSRAVKSIVVRSLDPLDRLVRRINGKQHLPPLHLRWEVGPLRGFESSAAEFRLVLQLFGGLRPDSRVLDIGCGCGQIALELIERLDKEGTYEGWDINSRAIQWCARTIGRVDRRFTFQTLDVRNGMYNPTGADDAASFKFPDNGQFDVILLKSVLTHMLREEVLNYLEQIPGLLVPRGRCTASCFLLNERQHAHERRGVSRIAFQPFRDNMAVVNPEVPEATVAFEEAEMMGMLRRARLRLSRPVLYGGWIGDPAALSHQDIMILERDH
jgi:SAM-dependent methyltransferase